MLWANRTVRIDTLAVARPCVLTTTTRMPVERSGFGPLYHLGKIRCQNMSPFRSSFSLPIHFVVRINIAGTVYTANAVSWVVLVGQSVGCRGGG